MYIKSYVKHVNMPKYQRLLTEGVRFHIYLAFMTSNK